MEKQLLLKKLEGKEAAVFFEKMYGKEGAKANKERYLHVMEGLEKAFGHKEMSLFSSAGRTEISGNHTDHNHGRFWPEASTWTVLRLRRQTGRTRSISSAKPTTRNLRSSFRI